MTAKDPSRISEQTRLESFEKIQDRARTWQEMILIRLRQLGKAAPWQVADTFGVTRQDVAPRITELAGQGLIVETGERVTDPVTGRSGAVWRPAK
jgi:predicted transcriptional regulator